MSIKINKMDGFTYNNIFETKGIEYLIIIAFLVMIIPFWIIINRKKVVRQQVRKGFGVLSAGILRIPMGLSYSRNHTWAHLERTGNARIGLDDFLLHITGDISLKMLLNEGDIIKKGDKIAEISRNGKNLRITSPLSGKIMEANAVLKDDPGTLNEDPYGKAWIYKIKPTDWIKETSSCYMAEGAVAWIQGEILRFKDFMAESFRKNYSENSILVLQDGGELRDQPLSDQPDEVWQNFGKSFLT